MRSFAKDNDKFFISSNDLEVILMSSDIERRRQKVLSTFGGPHEVLLRRENLLEDSLNQFDFSNKKIYVRYEGEMGEDAEGITRSFFSDFWQEFCKLYCKEGNLVIAPDRMIPANQVKKPWFYFSEWICYNRFYTTLH